MTGITTGPLLARSEGTSWEVVKEDRDFPGDPWSIALFFGYPDDGTAEANARAFVEVHAMVGRCGRWLAR